MDTQRFLLRSTRGVAQEIEFHVAPLGSGYCVKATHRIDGRFPKPGPCMLTPLPLEAAMTWQTPAPPNWPDRPPPSARPRPSRTTLQSCLAYEAAHALSKGQRLGKMSTFP